MLFTTNTPVSAHWAGKDTLALYQKNLPNQPADWYWRDRHVDYTVNSQGYRCAEWADIDWANSILLFGCSQTFGVGVSDEHTIDQHIRGAVNLGQGGTAPDFQWANTVRLCQQGIQPRACVYIWPYPARHTEFLGNGASQAWGTWNAGTWATTWLMEDRHVKTTLGLYRAAVDAQWSCPVVHLTYYEDCIEALGEGAQLVHTIDHARDLVHPGPQSHARVAELIKSQLGL